ncbi:membrane protein [Streptomyces olindensis]|nr:membrane protein [Streptomyces olindensis]
MWLVLLAPCTWFTIVPLVACYSFARSARVRAHRLFPPHGHRVGDDRQVVRVQKTRAWVAAVMSLLLLAVYGTPEDAVEARELYIMRLAVTPPLLLLSAPVVIAVLFRWASAQTRSAMRVRVRAALRSAGWYIGAVTALPLLGGAIVLLGRKQEASSGSPGAAPWLILAAALPLVWLLFFVGFATGPAIRTGFNTAAVHAALPALLTGTLVWEFTVISLLAGGLPPGPPVVQVLAVLGGPASVTAVAWWEIRRLRARHGVTLRA